MKGGLHMEIGLALSGGAVRGMAHIGVLKALEEAQIPFSMISGTSAGSLVGGVYAAGLSTSQIEAEALKLNDKLLDFNSSGLAKAVVGSIFGRKAAFSGIFKGKEVWKLADRMTNGINVQDAPKKVALCAVDLVRGETLFFTNANIPSVRDDYTVINDAIMADAITASCSIPVVFMPRPFGDRSLVDGGVTEYVPVKVLRDMGAGYVIAVDLGREAKQTQPADGVLEIAARSFDIMSRRLAGESLEHADVVIAPFVADIGLFDFSRTAELIERGYKAAKRMIPTIKMHVFQANSRRGATEFA
jgi:NTE family protein